MDSREEAADLLLYPNPAKSEITVANKNAAWQPAVYRIINALGLTLQTGKMTGSIQRIPVTSLVPGVYFIHIVTSKGFFSRKFEVLR